jgi:glycosyltransferase involved in cell wall biosynthesis
MRTYWTAHALAMHGHEVHVVTNAKEVELPFRMHMRAEDWGRCDAVYPSGSVRVHWTDPVDRSQSYIPMASSFVSKLAAIAARVHSECPFDVIYSHYLEPYGVAGYLAAQITGVPHVARMAGSDAGRLWHHPQFESLHDHVLRAANMVIAAGGVARRAAQRGVNSDRIISDGGFVVPEDVFEPHGPRLDLTRLRSQLTSEPDLRHLLWGEFSGDGPHFGVYGKLGERKGTFALLAAMHRLKERGVRVGLVALAHGQPEFQKHFRARARKLGLADQILQIPFLPHWRVPEFLRGCLAVCCLEQDFPIVFHTPIIPREVLISGTCLVGSAEVVRKLPSFERLPHRYGCIAIEDVNNVEELSSQLGRLAEDPETAAAIGARGRAFAREVQRDIPFPQALERVLVSVAAQQCVAASTISRASDETPPQNRHGRFPLTHLVAAAIGMKLALAEASDLMWARQVLDVVEDDIAGGESESRSLALAVRIEIAIAMAEDDADKSSPTESSDPLFRLSLKRWAVAEGALPELVAIAEPRLRIIEFDFDVSEFLGAQTIAAFPKIAPAGRSHIVAFGRSDDGRRDPLFIDEITARILQLSDGTRTISRIIASLEFESSRIADNVKWIENLFLLGLVSLRDAPVHHLVETPP